MKFLLCHNYYQQPGGEDQVFADEGWLLESHGHEVVRFTQHNKAIESMRRWDVARKAVWNESTRKQLHDLIRRERPAVIHFTNTFPLISPSAYSAAQEAGIPVVQSLHNYRLLCPGATFLRNGRVCEDCLGKRVPWPAVLHGCYRDCRTASGVVAGMLSLHRALGTFDRRVNTYIATTEFTRRKFLEAGFPPEKVAVKPNFVAGKPTIGPGDGGYAVFVGRLSPEKGITTLLAAWKLLPANVSLRIIGDGPLAAIVRKAAAADGRMEWLGRLSLAETCNIVGRAGMLVVPSVWYEAFGRAIVEAYSKGTPVIASRLGAMQELVDDGRTGLLFEPGDAGDLADQVAKLFRNPERLSTMRTMARDEYERKYTSEPNYQKLMEIYQAVLAKTSRRLLPDVNEAELKCTAVYEA